MNTIHLKLSDKSLHIQLQQQQDLYRDHDVKVRSHHSGARYNIKYATYWTKEKEYHIGIENNTDTGYDK